MEKNMLTETDTRILTSLVLLEGVFVVVIACYSALDLHARNYFVICGRLWNNALPAGIQYSALDAKGGLVGLSRQC